RPHAWPRRVRTPADRGLRRGALAEAAVDVVGGTGVGGVAEDLGGRAGFDDDAGGAVFGEEEGALVGDAGRLLHVVGDDHDGHLGDEFGDGLLDAAGGGGVQGRAGFVHEQEPGAYGE